LLKFFHKGSVTLHNTFECGWGYFEFRGMRRETQGFPGNSSAGGDCSGLPGSLSYGESPISMNTSRLPQSVYALLLVCGAIGAAHYYALVPERMASHFASDGTPNGWQLKEMFFLLMGLVAASTAIIGFLAPVLIVRRPASQINLPNKEYWLGHHGIHRWANAMVCLRCFVCDSFWWVPGDPGESAQRSEVRLADDVGCDGGICGVCSGVVDWVCAAFFADGVGRWRNYIAMSWIAKTVPGRLKPI
jgi:hypothetical protein